MAQARAHPARIERVAAAREAEEHLVRRPGRLARLGAGGKQHEAPRVPHALQVVKLRAVVALDEDEAAARSGQITRDHGGPREIS